jgi:hypothetical protein
LIMRVDIYPSKRVWHTFLLFFRLLYGSGAAIVSICGGGAAARADDCPFANSIVQM